MTSSSSSLEAVDILRVLPHRPPMLLIDRVEQVTPGEVIIALKNISAADPSLIGHFPERPIMPGVLLIEAMAQAGAILVHATEPFDPATQPLSLLGVDRARFRRYVVPGDTLRIKCSIASRRAGTWRLKASITVDGQPAAEAILLASVGDAEA